jgi:hypothetical protein
MRIRFVGQTKIDLVEGYDFYEKQEHGLGDYFLSCIYSDFEALKIYASIQQKSHEKFQRLLSKRFPFAIYYKVENEEIFVVTILDCRKNPRWIQKRLNDL